MKKKRKKEGGWAGYIGAKTVRIFNKINVFTASALINVYNAEFMSLVSFEEKKNLILTVGNKQCLISGLSKNLNAIRYQIKYWFIKEYVIL